MRRSRSTVPWERESIDEPTNAVLLLVATLFVLGFVASVFRVGIDPLLGLALAVVLDVPFIASVNFR